MLKVSFCDRLISDVCPHGSIHRLSINNSFSVKKKANIRKRYNQAQLTQGTIWESDKNAKKRSQTREPRSQDVSSPRLNFTNLQRRLSFKCVQVFQFHGEFLLLWQRQGKNVKKCSYKKCPSNLKIILRKMVLYLY